MEVQIITTVGTTSIAMNHSSADVDAVAVALRDYCSYEEATVKDRVSKVICVFNAHANKQRRARKKDTYIIS